MIAFSELTSTLRVTEYKIDIVDLDYIKLSSQFKPAGDVVAINSNFVHICLDGYSRFLTEPKLKPACGTSPSGKSASGNRGGLHAGDRSVFNACIEFTVKLAGDNGTVLRYFPRSGRIQLFTCDYVIDTFLKYLRGCGLPEFTSVVLVGNTKTLLDNYKFRIILDSNKMINLSNFQYALEISIPPFPLHFIKLDPSDSQLKFVIVFKNKIRLHLWPVSGKVNLFGSKDYISSKFIYDYLLDLFTLHFDVGFLLCDTPLPDKLRIAPKKSL